MSFFVTNNVYQGSFLAGSTVFADEYEAHGVFSINASNQFRGSLWLTKNASVLMTSLTTADYQVFDADGNAVAGLSQVGVTPDVNGIFEITAVSAAGLTDLTHYVVKITIYYDGETYISYRGITLAE